MNPLLRVVLFAISCLFASSAESQVQPSQITIGSGTGQIFTHSPTDRYKHIIYSVYLPSGSIAILGFQRVRGSGDMDLRVGTSFRSLNYERAEISGVVASDLSGDARPDVLIWSQRDFLSDTFHIEAWSVDNRAGTWEIHYEAFDIAGEIAAAFAMAAVQYFIQCALLDSCNDNSSAVENNIGRAVNLGMSVVARTSVCAVGSDVIMNEINRELSQEISSSSYASMVLGQFMSSFVAKVAKVQCRY